MSALSFTIAKAHKGAKVVVYTRHPTLASMEVDRICDLMGWKHQLIHPQVHEIEGGGTVEIKSL